MDDLASVSYEHQFNRTYDARLAELKPYIIRSVRAQNGVPILDTILGVEEELDTSTCVIVGTLFVASDLKPSIFDKIDRKSKKLKEVETKTYYTEDIKYLLEDGSGRIELEFLDVGDIYRKHFVLCTGMCVGVQGRRAKKGKFLAEDIIFPFSNPRSLPLGFSEVRPGKRLCFISGLSLDDGSKNKERMMVLCDYLRIVGVSEYVVIGSFFGESKEVSRQMLSELDDVLGYAKAKINLVPNTGDFGSKILPLMPVHPKLFTFAVASHANPCRLDIDGRKVLTTTRFVIEDILRYLPQDLKDVQGEAFEYKMHLDMEKIEDIRPKSMNSERNIINAMRVLMKAGHVCPTAPDTVPSVPFSGKDLFVVADPIDYFCVGGTDEFLDGQSEDNSTLFFTIPKFSKRHEVVVLDTGTRELEVVRFDMKDFD
ncbi:DNA polymerase delta regulatory subunit B [Encephalitozoon intestinalis ATCC 50506]|uniref:DNA polymerase delta regulatory subunit B n=1 Tax=Encephalitozoon intestinalis (strain ATCC 50506) TaxID=876142 RepID=E0S9D8_ENCIT|nr:DNA polymerase delta regulatory subunit B [Encephalitozoon intestinalis ATCC 50506]ADM12202.1 DNA polymerase delta regulatory subunit B [Encephalitozoon intestinalis ATCC 50506]